MIKPAATKTEPSTRTGRVLAEWLYGAGCARFSMSIAFGHGGIHRVSAEVSAVQIEDTARTLRGTGASSRAAAASRL